MKNPVVVTCQLRRSNWSSMLSTSFPRMRICLRSRRRPTMFGSTLSLASKMRRGGKGATSWRWPSWAESAEKMCRMSFSSTWRMDISRAWSRGRVKLRSRPRGGSDVYKGTKPRRDRSSYRSRRCFRRGVHPRLQASGCVQVAVCSAIDRLPVLTDLLAEPLAWLAVDPPYPLREEAGLLYTWLLVLFEV